MPPRLRRLRNGMSEAASKGCSRHASPEDSEEVWTENFYRLLDRLNPDIRLGIYECPYPYKRILRSREIQAMVGTGKIHFLKEKLLEELEEIRKRGYSTDNMEHEFGISCVAVPLFGLSGEIIGAVSVSGPSLRFTAQTIPVIYATMSGILEEVQYVY